MGPGQVREQVPPLPEWKMIGGRFRSVARPGIRSAKRWTWTTYEIL